MTVGDRAAAAIGRGLVVLLGVERTDTAAEAEYLAGKIAALRVFEDGAGRMNRTVTDVGGSVLLVPNFTLCADTRRGRRPSFSEAAPPERARALCAEVERRLRDVGVPTESGVFGAHMLVQIENDGPVTLVLERTAP